MRLGLTSFAFGWGVQASPPVDALALLGFASECGLQVVQLADNLPVHRLEPSARERVTATADHLGLRLELGMRGLTEQALATYLGLSLSCGARVLRVVVDAPSLEPTPRDIISLVRNAAGAIRAAGVTLAIENHDRFPARALRGIVDAVGSANVGVCLDTANSLGAGEGLEYVATILAPVTVNCHVKDVRIARLPHQMGFVVTGVPLGHGQLPIRRVVDRLIEEGRCQSILVETWTAPLTDAAATLAAERASVDTSVGVLQAWMGGRDTPAAADHMEGDHVDR